MVNGIKEQILFLKARIKKSADAFGELYDMYVDKIYRFIFFKVSSEEDARDLTSEVFLKTWQYIMEKGRTTHIENFRALIYKIARNTVIDFYRRRARHAEREEPLKDNTPDAKRLEKDIERKFDSEKIKAALAEMKEEYRDVILLRHLEGFSIGDISRIMNKPNVAVRVMLHRAMKTLKKVMEEKK